MAQSIGEAAGYGLTVRTNLKLKHKFYLQSIEHVWKYNKLLALILILRGNSVCTAAGVPVCVYIYIYIKKGQLN